jgi:site-specific recombinase XerD
MTQPNDVPAVQPGKPKLLDQVRHRCRLRHLARSTEHAYVGWIRRYILFHDKRHPLEMGAPEVTRFLTHLAVDGNVSASTQNQALSVLLFLYREVLERDFGWLEDVVRAKKPKRLPVVFTPEEAMAIIEVLQGVRWLMGTLLYGGGLFTSS